MKTKSKESAWLRHAPTIAGRKVEIRKLGKILFLERVKNKFFSKDSDQGDFAAMTEVLFVATRVPAEVRELDAMEDEERAAALMAYADEITMDDVNEFGKYFESVLDEINESGADTGKQTRTAKKKTDLTGSRSSSGSAAEVLT